MFIAPNTTLLNDRYPTSECLTPPTIEDEAVVGGCVVILPNVRVGEKAVIAAGSVVTSDVPSKKVVMGAPAKTIMTVKEYEGKRVSFVKTRLR